MSPAAGEALQALFRTIRDTCPLDSCKAWAKIGLSADNDADRRQAARFLAFELKSWSDGRLTRLALLELAKIES